MPVSPTTLRIAVLFGGRSPEHDVSVLSPANVINALATEKYDAVPIYVTREGRWQLSRFKSSVLSKPEHGT